MSPRVPYRQTHEDFDFIRVDSVFMRIDLYCEANLLTGLYSHFTAMDPLEPGLGFVLRGLV